MGWCACDPKSASRNLRLRRRRLRRFGRRTMVLARLWEVMQTTTRDSVAQFLLLSSLVALSGRLVKMSHQHDDEKNALMEQLQAERDRHRGVLRRNDARSGGEPPPESGAVLGREPRRQRTDEWRGAIFAPLVQDDVLVLAACVRACVCRIN